MKLEFEALSENEAFARTVAAAYLVRFNPTMSELEDIKTAVSEAVTNAVVHGYGGAPGMVEMECRQIGTTASAGTDVEIVVRDHGVGISNLDRALKPMFTTCRDGERPGLGFTVMEAFSDEMRVESIPNVGTTVALRKRLGAVENECQEFPCGAELRSCMEGCQVF